MPRTTLDAILQRQHNRTRSGESLQRLQRNLDHVRQVEAAVEQQFQDWQSRWLERCEQLRQRLETLERQLAALSPLEPARPQLALISAHHHDGLILADE